MRPLPVDRAIADAYSIAGPRWRAGPAVLYGRLAVELVGRSPRRWDGVAALDIGAGTGAASAAMRRAGAASVVAVDAARGMLAVDAGARPPAAVADARSLPFATASFDAAVAAFVLNHLDDPAAGLAEAARVVRAGGVVLASSYAADDAHPVKEVVEEVLRELGGEPAGWQGELRRARVPLLASTEGCRSALADAGLSGTVEHVRVGFPELSPEALVRWRLGMAQHAPFVERLPAEAQRWAARTAVERLGSGAPPLVRSFLAIVASSAV